MSAKEVDACIVSFFSLFTDPPQAYRSVPLKRGKGWRSRVLDEACKLVTPDEWSACTTVVAQISKGPPPKRLYAPQLPKDLDYEALERVRAKLKAIKPAADNLRAFGQVGQGFQTHRDSEEYSTSQDPRGWLGRRVRRFDPRAGRWYDGVIVKWTEHGENPSTGEKEAWYRVQDDVDPAHPLDARLSDLDECEVLAALKASQDEVHEPPREQQTRLRHAMASSGREPLQPSSLLQLFWQRKGRSPPERSDLGQTKRRRVAPSTADATSLVLRVEDFPIGQASAPLRRVDVDEETGRVKKEYVEWCSVVGHSGKDTLRVHVPHASESDKCTVSLLEVQRLIESRGKDELLRQAHVDHAGLCSSSCQHVELGSSSCQLDSCCPEKSMDGELAPCSPLHSQEESPYSLEEAPDPQALDVQRTAEAERTESKVVAARPREGLAQGVKGDTSSSLCVVCLDNSATHALVPCGHQCACRTCVLQLEGSPCPICRKQVASSLRVFIP